MTFPISHLSCCSFSRRWCLRTSRQHRLDRHAPETPRPVAERTSVPCSSACCALPPRRASQTRPRTPSAPLPHPARACCSRRPSPPYGVCEKVPGGRQRCARAARGAQAEAGQGRQQRRGKGRKKNPHCSQSFALACSSSISVRTSRIVSSYGGSHVARCSLSTIAVALSPNISLNSRGAGLELVRRDAPPI